MKVCNLGSPSTLILALVLAIVSLSNLYGQNTAEDLWKKAFYLFESSKESESQDALLDALNQASEAQKLYDLVANNFPEFQPGIIQFKRRQVADAYARIRAANKQKMLNSARPKRPQNLASQPLQPGSHQLQPRGEFAPSNKSQGPGFSSGNSRPSQGVYIQPANSLPQTPQIAKGPGNNNNFALPLYSSSARASDFYKSSQQFQNQMSSELNQLRLENGMLRRRQKEIEASMASKDLKIAQKTRELQRMRENPTTAGETGVLLGKAMQVIRELTAQNDALNRELVATRKQNKTLQQQVQKLTRERDDLQRIVDGKGLGSEQLRNLMKENKNLNNRLDILRQITERTAEDSQMKDQVIADLKYEIQKIRDDRDKLMDENVRHKVAIEKLYKKLELLSDSLSDENQSKLVNLAPEEREENALLRSVIIKQLRRHQQQKQAKELVLQELAQQVGTHSTILLEAVNDLARGAKLTPEEKALFRSPQMSELFKETESEQFELLSAPANSKKKLTLRNGQKTQIELSQIEKAARLDFKEGRLDEAEAGFLNFLHHRPQNVACLCNLGVLKLQLNNHSEAQNYLRRAAAIDPNSGLANYLLGRSYFLQSDYDEAYNFMERSIQLNPKNDKAQNCIGVIASQKGWISRAKRAFSAAVGINPNNADAHFNLAILHTSQAEHNPTKVSFHYFKALDIYKAEQISTGGAETVIRDPAIEKFLKENPLKGV